jgi:hypothetical protein
MPVVFMLSMLVRCCRNRMAPLFSLLGKPRTQFRPSSAMWCRKQHWRAGCYERRWIAFLEGGFAYYLFFWTGNGGRFNLIWSGESSLFRHDPRALKMVIVIMGWWISSRRHDYCRPCLPCQSLRSCNCLRRTYSSCTSSLEGVKAVPEYVEAHDVIADQSSRLPKSSGTIHILRCLSIARSLPGWKRNPGQRMVTGTHIEYAPSSSTPHNLVTGIRSWGGTLFTLSFQGCCMVLMVRNLRCVGVQSFGL